MCGSGETGWGSQMKTFILVCALTLGGVVSGSAPLLAASSETEAFSAHVRLDAAFLANASRLAETNASSAAIKSFARSQQAEQTHVLGLLDGTSAQQLASSEDADSVLATGRSAASPLDVDMTKFAPPLGVLMPVAGMTLEHLSAANGEAFDALYRSTVRNVLSDLAGFYEAYAKTGDDPALRAMSSREFTRVEAAASGL